MESLNPNKSKSSKDGSGASNAAEQQDFEAGEYTENNNNLYKLPKEVIRKFDEQAFVLAKSKSGEYNESRSGNDSEGNSHSKNKQKSSDNLVEERKQPKPASNSDCEMKIDRHDDIVQPAKGKRTDGYYGSSVGSTKDRDNSHSSSHNSKDDSDSNVRLSD